MKRRTFLAAAAVLGAATGLSACGNQNAGSSGDGELTKETKADLTLFYWDKAQTPTVEANIKAFNEEYPNITVTPSVAVYDDYWTKLRAQAEGEQLPDVFWMNGPNFQLYASNGMLADLTDLGEIAWESYPKALVDLYSLDGKKYGVPKDYDTIACFVNKKVFEQAGIAIPTDGWTWDEHREAIKAVKASGATWGAVIEVTANQTGYYNTIHQAGGHVLKDGRSGFDDPKAIEGIQYLKDLLDDGSIPSPQIVADSKADALFMNGDVGLLWAGSWMVKPLREKFGDDELVVVPLPKKEKEATIIHGLSYAAAAKSKNLAAAKALVRFMTDKKANETEASNGTAIPAFTGTQQVWLDQVPAWKLDVFTKAAENYAVPYPVSKNTTAWTEKETVLKSVFTGEAEITAVCTQLAADVNALLEKE
ncbi:MAG: sugar ABC transporter substrate-binding protein [Arachnia propionica]|uniref:ABC transporter substrate-binding protein n=1 Tax=Arachnia propionica TaxID=1750 RepID=UPI0026FF4221|nr:sugar ABC transporter substrate-binding protein [Arachnia propionica]